MIIDDILKSYLEKIEVFKKLNLFLRRELWKNKDVLNYIFKRRGFSSNDVNLFQLGYDPGNTVLNDYLNRNNIPLSSLSTVGYLTQNENDTFYDKFEDRIIFPIHNIKGHVVGFSGRVWREDDNRGKYTLTNNSGIFQKSFNLYGLYHNLNSINRYKTAMLVEGNTDVISCKKASINIAVSAFGTSFMEEHLQVLMMFADKFIFCQDNDSAGEKSIQKIKQIVSPYKNIQVAYLKLEGPKDPDDYIKKYGGDSLKNKVSKIFEEFHSV